MDSTYQNSLSSCLGRTCLKWGSDGELSPPDLNLVMQRLALVDEEVAALNLLTSAPPGSPPVSQQDPRTREKPPFVQVCVSGRRCRDQGRSGLGVS